MEEKLQKMKDDLEKKICQQSMLIYHMYTLALQLGKTPAVPTQSPGLLDQGANVSAKHTIAAHNLLTWPVIKALLPEGYSQEYVMDLEGGRGPIQVYGQDDANSGASLSFETDEHGITECGIFTTDPDTVRSLHLSYMNLLHKVHPFLDEKDLENKVETFIGTYCSVGRLNTTNSYREQGTKRRRLTPARSYCKPLSRSVENAMVLLVLALGSICECRNYPLPNLKPQSHCEKRNVLPGLAYYGYAAQILGGLQGNNDLPHVQAALLAGLYTDQLAHPCQLER